MMVENARENSYSLGESALQRKHLAVCASILALLQAALKHCLYLIFEYQSVPEPVLSSIIYSLRSQIRTDFWWEKVWDGETPRAKLDGCLSCFSLSVSFNETPFYFIATEFDSLESSFLLVQLDQDCQLIVLGLSWVSAVFHFMFHLSTTFVWRW